MLCVFIGESLIVFTGAPNYYIIRTWQCSMGEALFGDPHCTLMLTVKMLECLLKQELAIAETLDIVKAFRRCEETTADLHNLTSQGERI